MFNLREVKLLWSKYRTWSGNSDPADKSLSIDLVVLHGVQADESTCAAETSFAVDSDGASSWVSEVGLAGGHELVYDRLRWGRTIGEHHILVVDVLV